jgi:hypothetical protein
MPFKLGHSFVLKYGTKARLAQVKMVVTCCKRVKYTIVNNYFYTSNHMLIVHQPINPTEHAIGNLVTAFAIEMAKVVDHLI